jgi:hypothetical protein
MSRAILLAISVAFATSGCGRAPDAGAALAETARHSLDDGDTGAAIGTGTGEFRRITGDDMRLPDDFPADIVLPEHYAVVSVTTMGPSQSVVLASDEPMAKLVAHFREGQAARGWHETVSMQGIEGAMVGLRKGSRGVLANFRPDPHGNTLVSLSVQPQVLPVAR